MPASAAQAALKFAKAYSPLGPDNQNSGQTAPVKPWTPVRTPEKKHYAKVGVTNLKKIAPSQGCTMADIFAYAREVMKTKAGNCLEQSALVCLFLSMHPTNPNFRLVRLSQPADHVFVAINQNPDGQGYFPDNFSAWNPNAVIVDPWVGICVKAKNYPEIWRMTLDVMGSVGMELPRAAGGWQKADDASWRTAPTLYRKLSFTI